MKKPSKEILISKKKNGLIEYKVIRDGITVYLDKLEIIINDLAKQGWIVVSFVVAQLPSGIRDYLGPLLF